MASDPDRDPARWRMLGLVSVTALATLTLWFSATAITPQLSDKWRLSASEAGWLTAIVQLGFVAGTALAALLNVADIVPARWLVASSAVLASAANAALLIAPGYGSALVTRFFIGFFIAGVYPPGMKMLATWFRRYRGLAIGSLIAGVTIGKAFPYLVRALQGARIEPVILVPSAVALAGGAMIAWLYRDGPFPFPRRPFSWALVATALGDRGTRLAIAGYLGHMWELYAMWTWLPAFLIASEAERGRPPGSLPHLVTFLAIAAGALGCLWAGWAAQRSGYARIVTWCLAASGACSLMIGFLFGQSTWLLALVACIWGFFVVADSAQFSAMVTEAAPSHAVGTALTVQTSMGFLLTMLTIQLVPVLVSLVGWRYAFAVLALGPIAGIAAIGRLPRNPTPAQG